MRYKEGIFILDEVNSKNMKERFQGFEGVVICMNGSMNMLDVKEGYYKNENYEITHSLAMATVFEKQGETIIPELKNWVRKAVVENLDIFKDRLPEIAITMKAAKMLGIS